MLRMYIHMFVMTSGRRKEGGGGKDTYGEFIERKPSTQPESIFQSEKAVSQVYSRGST